MGTLGAGLLVIIVLCIIFKDSLLKIMYGLYEILINTFFAAVIAAIVCIFIGAWVLVGIAAIVAFFYSCYTVVKGKDNFISSSWAGPTSRW